MGEYRSLHRRKGQLDGGLEREPHAQGRVTFGDPEKPLRIVMRAGDKTPVLSLGEERALSAIPPEYATNAKKIDLKDLDTDELPKIFAPGGSK